jgi:hypothetical protein
MKLSELMDEITELYDLLCPKGHETNFWFSKHKEKNMFQVQIGRTDGKLLYGTNIFCASGSSQFMACQNLKNHLKTALQKEYNLLEEKVKGLRSDVDRVKEKTQEENIKKWFDNMENKISGPICPGCKGTGIINRHPNGPAPNSAAGDQWVCLTCEGTGKLMTTVSNPLKTLPQDEFEQLKKQLLADVDFTYKIKEALEKGRLEAEKAQQSEPTLPGHYR